MFPQHPSLSPQDTTRAPLPRLPLLPCAATLDPWQKGRFQLYSACCAHDKYTSEEQDKRLISYSSSPKRRIKKRFLKITVFNKVIVVGGRIKGKIPDSIPGTSRESSSVSAFCCTLTAQMLSLCLSAYTARKPQNSEKTPFIASM